MATKSANFNKRNKDKYLFISRHFVLDASVCLESMEAAFVWLNLTVLCYATLHRKLGDTLGSREITSYRASRPASKQAS